MIRRVGASVVVAVAILAAGFYACGGDDDAPIASQPRMATLGTILKAENIVATGTITAGGVVTSLGAQVFTSVDTGGGLVDSTTPGSVGLTRACNPTQVLQWGGTAWSCATISGGGTVTTAAPITGTGSAGSAIGLSLTTTTCAGGSAETATAANGTSTCSQVVTAISPGTGISHSYTPSTGVDVVNVNLTPTTCSTGSAETATAAAGTSTCSAVVDSVAGLTGATGGLSCSTTTGAASCWAGSATGCSAGSGLEDVTGGSAGWQCVAWPSGGGNVSGTLTSGDVPYATALHTLANSDITNNPGVSIGLSSDLVVNEGTNVTVGAGGAALIVDSGLTSVGSSEINQLGWFEYNVIATTATDVGGALNNYNPAGFGSASGFDVTPTGQVDMTGMVSGFGGRVVINCNIGTSNEVFYNENTNSTAANRFHMPGGIAWTLEGASTNSCAMFVYDPASSRWKLLSWASNVFPGATFTTDVTQTSGSFHTNGNFQTTSGGQIDDAGTKPAITSGCGTTGSSIVGGAYSGQVTTTAGAGSCLLTFGTAMIAPTCVVTDAAGGSSPAASVSTAALTITATATHAYNFDCRSH